MALGWGQMTSSGPKTRREYGFRSPRAEKHSPVAAAMGCFRPGSRWRQESRVGSLNTTSRAGSPEYTWVRVPGCDTRTSRTSRTSQGW